MNSAIKFEVANLMLDPVDDQPLKKIIYRHDPTKRWNIG